MFPGEYAGTPRGHPRGSPAYPEPRRRSPRVDWLCNSIRRSATATRRRPSREPRPISPPLSHRVRTLPSVTTSSSAPIPPNPTGVFFLLARRDCFSPPIRTSVDNSTRTLRRLRTGIRPPSRARPREPTPVPTAPRDVAIFHETLSELAREIAVHRDAVRGASCTSHRRREASRPRRRRRIPCRWTRRIVRARGTNPGARTRRSYSRRWGRVANGDAAEGDVLTPSDTSTRLGTGVDAVRQRDDGARGASGDGSTTTASARPGTTTRSG